MRANAICTQVLFLYCNKQLSTEIGNVPNRTLFGDGVLLVGCLLLHVLLQRQRFQLFDFAEQVMRG